MQPEIVTINRAVKTGYPLTSVTWPYRGLKYRPIENFLSADNLLVFKWSQAQVHFFKCIRNELSRTIKILISIWPRTRKFSQLLRAKQGKAVAFDFSRHGHALVTLYVQFLCSDWSKFDRWVHAESLCSIWKLVYFDSWSWQSFVSSSCDVFNNCHQDSSVIHGSFVYWVFGWEMRRLSKIGNQISHGVVFVFHLAWYVRGLKSLKWWWLLAAASRLVSLSNYCIWCLLVSFPVLDCEVERCLCG